MASEVIKLNLIPKGEMPVFHASQFDTGRLITCELYRGEDAYSVPEGYTVELHCRKVDNNIVTMASTLINDNVVTFTSTEQLTACNGNNLCEVAILDEGYRIGTLNFILEVEIDPLKGGITSTSEIHNLESQVEEITTEIIGENYYNKTEVDDLLDTKADASSVYTKTQVDSALALKANAADVYTKSQTDTLLSAKANSSDVYTKGQVDTALAAKANAADVYTKGQVDTALAAKANAADVYTKGQVDTALAAKANAADVYTKGQVDTALAAKADVSDLPDMDLYYTKTQVDNIILDIMPVDTAGPSSIVSFDTALAADLVDCKTTLAPSLTGYTAVNLTACGVNLFDKDGVNVINAYLSTKIEELAVARTVFAKCKPSTQYTVSKTAGQRFIVAYTKELPALNVPIYGAIQDATASHITITTGVDAKYIVSMVYNGNVDTVTADEMLASVQIAEGTDTTYHAYTGNAYTIQFEV